MSWLPVLTVPGLMLPRGRCAAPLSKPVACGYHLCWGRIMVAKDKKIRVLLARFSLEPHSRGVITVAGMLKDAGMEVILMANARPQEIIRAAKQEKVDVVGVSSYCGGELALCRVLFEAAEGEGIKDQTVFLLGGIFPPGDAPTLKELGFSAVFPPSSTREEIVAAIESAVALKR